MSSESRLPGLRDMVAAAEPGECPFCGDPCKKVPEGQGASGPPTSLRAPGFYLTCGDPECLVAYHRCYKRDYRRDRQSTAAVL